VKVTGQLKAMPGLTLGKGPHVHWLGEWVTPRAGLDFLPLLVFEPLIMRTYIIQKNTTVTPLSADKRT